MKPYLHAEKIEFIPKGRALPVLQETTISIFPEEFVIILGHNGSGKSTLAKILAGYVKPTHGKVFIDKVQIDRIPLSQKANMLITLTQKIEDRLFAELTLEENILLWESRFPINMRLNVDQFIKSTYLPDKFAVLLKQPMLHFSVGEKQVILLSFAIAHPPKILFLDEHISNLDHQASREIMDITAQVIRSHKITTLMITHNLEDAINYGSRIIILRDGQIVIDQKKSTNFSMQQLKEMLPSQ